MRKVFGPAAVSTPAGGLCRKDAAAYLDCSTRYLDKLAAAGELRKAKLGRKTIFLRAELDRFLASKLELKAESHVNQIQVGTIGVDAGVCWIGDPCYVLHSQKPPKDIGQDWDDFCVRLLGSRLARQFCFDGGRAGLGVCVRTGYGDGIYPVYADITSDGRVRSATVQFIVNDEGQD